MKRCKSCRLSKPLADFYKNPKGRGGLRPECKECTKERRRAWYAANREAEAARVREWYYDNPEKVLERIARMRGSQKKKLADRKSYLKRTYGITVERYDTMLEAQGGVCKICGEPRPEERTLHVDHDHETGAIRGLLCFRCNNAIGDLRDDHDLARELADYLDQDDELAALTRERVLALTKPQ